MIMKANKQIGFIYKNEESIDKILKDGEVVFECGFLREKTSTTLPITFGGVGKDLKDYRVYGNTYQNSTSGRNKYGITNYQRMQYSSGLPSNTSDGIVVDTSDLNNISFHTTNNQYLQVLLPTFQLEPNTDYILSYTRTNNLTSGTNARRWYYTIDSNDNYVLNYAYNAGDSGDKIYQFTTGETGKIAFAFGFNNYSSGSSSEINNLMVRLASDTDDTFEPYTNGASPNPGYLQEIISCGDNKTGLPFGYTQVDYIESSGTQYIDTGWYPDYSKNFEIEATINPQVSDKRYCILSNYLNTSEYNLSLETNINNKVRFYINSSITNDLISSNTIETNKFTTIKFNYNENDSKYSILMNGISSKKTTNVSKEKLSLSTYLFLDQGQRVTVFNNSLQLKRISIKENDKLIRDFIPCYRNSDNEVGLYDIVNNVFYTNQGTGVFTYGSEIEKGGYKIPVNVRSENLFDKDNMTLNEYIRNDGTTLSTDYWDISNYIELEPNKTYTYNGLTSVGTSSVQSAYYDINKNFISTFKQAVGATTITTPSNAYYVRFSINKGANDKNTFQFKQGSTVPSKYIPYYNETTNIYLDEPLRKIGDYADYIDFINGKVIRKIRKIILDGSEDWAKSYGNNLFNLQHYLDDAMFIVGYGLSNYYRYNSVQSGIDANTKNGEFVLQSSYGGNVMIKNTDYTVINDFKTWLSTHNTEILYPLATPTEETITLPNIPTVDGNNTLNIEAEITPSQVYIKYKSNE